MSSSTGKAETGRLKMCVTCTTAIGAATLYRGLFEYLHDHGYDITLIVGEPYEAPEHLRDRVKVVVIPTARAPSPVADLKALVRMIRFFARNRFDLAHISTPKASFLSAIALRLTGHRRLIYVVRGRAYENLSGPKRRILAAMERFTCALSSVVIPVARHLEESLVREGLCAPRKIRFLGRGSSNGINLARFERTPERREKAAALRRQLGLSPETLVILIIGRLAEDKGIAQGLRAFEIVSPEAPDARLVIAGPDDPREPLSATLMQRIENDPRIIRVGWVEDTPAMYAMADILLYPSLREGFGNVGMEGSASSLPVIGFAAQGPAEIVLDGETGFLAKPYDADELGEKLLRVVKDPELRRRMGENGRAFMTTYFDNKVIWAALEDVMAELLARSR